MWIVSMAFGLLGAGFGCFAGVVALAIGVEPNWQPEAYGFSAMEGGGNWGLAFAMAAFAILGAVLVRFKPGVSGLLFLSAAAGGLFVSFIYLLPVLCFLFAAGLAFLAYRSARSRQRKVGVDPPGRPAGR
jgi:hypothetical protein